MKHLAGLDKSLEETATCVAGETATIVKLARAMSEPQASSEALRDAGDTIGARRIRRLATG